MNSYDPRSAMNALGPILQAYLSLYEKTSSLTADYLRSMINAVNDPRTLTATPSGTPQSFHSPPTPPPPARNPTMVIEGEDGKPAFGMFLVENHLPEVVSATVTIDPLLDDAGREASPQLSFDPPTISLQPGEQALLRVTMLVDSSMEPGASYRTNIRVPGLSREPISMVARRRASAQVARGNAPASRSRASSRRKSGAAESA